MKYYGNTNQEEDSGYDKDAKFFFIAITIATLAFGYLIAEGIAIDKKYDAYNDYNNRNRVDTIQVRR